MLVVSPVGGNIERWQYATPKKVVDVFFPRGYAMNAEGKLRISGGMHQCIPNFGATAAKYELPQHGSLRGTICTYVHPVLRSENGQTFRGVSMEFHLLGNRISFPWTVGGLIRVTALPNGFAYETSVKCVGVAGGTKSMPRCFGLHPYFSTLHGGSVDLPDEQLIFQPMQPKLVRAGNKIHVHLGAIGDVAMTMEGYSDVVVWSDSHQYGCVEPVTGEPSLFGSPYGDYMPPDKDFVFRVRFEFEPEEE